MLACGKNVCLKTITVTVSRNLKIVDRRTFFSPARGGIPIKSNANVFQPVHAPTPSYEFSACVYHILQTRHQRIEKKEKRLPHSSSTNKCSYVR